MKLHTRILLGLLIGATVGIACNLGLGADHTWVRGFDHWVAAPVGQIFLRLLFMVVMPLVFASIALGVAGIGDVGRVGRIGGKTLAYFLATTALSAITGLILVSIVRPGADLDPATRDGLLATYAADAANKVEASTTAVKGFGIDTLVGIVTRNPLKSAVEFDMLGVIFFGLMFGAALTVIDRQRAKPMIELLESLDAVVTKIIGFAMRLAPIGVAGLVFGVTSKFGFALLKPLGIYVALVLFALVFHAVVNLSLVLRFVIGISPLVFVSRIRAALVTAFSTSSSSATLPTNITVAEQRLGIPSHIAGFVLPLGTTMCMNGTALFEGITVLFLCQVFGIVLDVGQMAVVMLMAVITAVGAAGVPGGSIPLLVGVLTMVGVPGEGIAIVLGVDRLLDMARTTVNVFGDQTAALFVAKSEGLWTPDSLPPEEPLYKPDGAR